MIEVFCTCGKRFRAKPEQIGHWAQCAKCGQRFVIEARVGQGELIAVDLPFSVVIQDEPLGKKSPQNRSVGQVFYRNRMVVVGAAVSLLALACLFGYLIRPIADAQRQQMVPQPVAEASKRTIDPLPVVSAEKLREQVMAKNLREWELETRESRRKAGEETPKEVIALGKAMFDAEEQYRQAWLRTHDRKERAFKTSYPHGLNYFGENLAELLGLEKGEEWALERKRKGECIAQQPPFHLD